MLKNEFSYFKKFDCLILGVELDLIFKIIRLLDTTKKI